MINIIRIAICDDNQLDREIITALLHEYFTEKSITYQCVQYKNGTFLVHDTEDGEYFDIIILDIFMDNMLGIDVAKKMREMNYKGKIIFLTSSAEYAIESYDVEASGYLLKPHSYEKICMIMDRIIPDCYVGKYRIKHRNIIKCIPYNDILYIESCNSKCILHSNMGEFTIYKHLKDIEAELNDSRFLKCHQSYIVNMKHIKSVDKHFILYSGDTVLIRQKSLRSIKQTYLDYISLAAF